MCELSVEDKNGSKYKLLDIVTVDNKVKCVLLTVDGRIILTDYYDIKEVKINNSK